MQRLPDVHIQKFPSYSQEGETFSCCAMQMTDVKKGNESDFRLAKGGFKGVCF